MNRFVPPKSGFPKRPMIFNFYFFNALVGLPLRWSRGFLSTCAAYRCEPTCPNLSSTDQSPPFKM